MTKSHLTKRFHRIPTSLLPDFHSQSSPVIAEGNLRLQYCRRLAGLLHRFPIRAVGTVSRVHVGIVISLQYPVEVGPSKPHTVHDAFIRLQLQVLSALGRFDATQTLFDFLGVFPFQSAGFCSFRTEGRSRSFQEAGPSGRRRWALNSRLGPYRACKSTVAIALVAHPGCAPHSQRSPICCHHQQLESNRVL